MTVLRWVLAVLGLVLVLAAGFGGYAYYRYYDARTLAAGATTVRGISAPVKIVRDRYGVPHIFGAKDEDVYFGLGYAQAQDRFFQMDLTRRAMQGRLAEIIGKAGVPLDAQARTRNWNGIAAAQLAGSSPYVRGALAAYTAGVNARLSEGKPPGEYALLFAKPEPWRVEDSIASGLALVMDQTFGLGFEADRARLAQKISAAQIAQFIPPYPTWAPVVIGGPAGADAAREGDGARNGSNAWALAGARTESGKPLLANDPHISLRAPSTFYLTHLKLSSGDVAGASLPGTPFVVLGRGPHAAWGITNGEIDGEDYVSYTDQEAANFPVRLETIRVRGGEDVKLFIRDAPEGPIVDPQYFPGVRDVVSAGNQGALRSVAHDLKNQPIMAILALQQARDAEAARNAARLMRAPILNFVVATDSGEIGFALAGALPVRDAQGKWTGESPEADRPFLANPAAGMIVSANNKQVFDDKFVGGFSPWRAARIIELLADRKFSAAATGEIQKDVVSLSARRLLPALKAATPKTDAGKAVQRDLAAWDGAMSAGARAPLVYAAWLRALAQALYGDELGPALARTYAYPRFTFLDTVFNGGAGAWCDDGTTAGKVETCADTAGAAMDAVGANPPPEGNWGASHQAVFANPLLSPLPFLGSAYTTRTAVGGDGSTINAMHFYGEGDYTSDFGPGYRAVYDLADLNRSRFMLAPGQSENILSPHYRDLAPLWARGEGVEIAGDWTPDNPPAGAQVLTLSPR